MSLNQRIKVYVDPTPNAPVVLGYKGKTAGDRWVDDQYRFAWLPKKIDGKWIWFKPYWTKRKVSREIDAAAFYCPYVPLTSHGEPLSAETSELVSSFQTRYGYFEFVNARHDP